MGKEFKSVEIPVVRDKDLRVILSNFGILDDLERGAIQCACCGCRISWENLGLLRIVQEHVVLCCGNSDCISSVGGGGNE